MPCSILGLDFLEIRIKIIIKNIRLLEFFKHELTLLDFIITFGIPQLEIFIILNINTFPL